MNTINLLYQPQVRQTEPEIPRRATDPTRTLITWREFSDAVADRVDQLKLAEGLHDEEVLVELLNEMDTELMDLFETYLYLMMQKGILFATEHMNRLDPKYHFEAGWSPANDELLANLLASCHTLLTNWTSDIRKDAAIAIRKGTAAGLSIEEIGKDVADIIGGKRFRGTVIARTELMRAWNEAAFDRYFKAGFCKERGFIPPLHPLCRCGIIVVLTETGFEASG